MPAAAAQQHGDRQHQRDLTWSPAAAPVDNTSTTTPTESTNATTEQKHDLSKVDQSIHSNADPSQAA
jgi:hypothetical protein